MPHKRTNGIGGEKLKVLVHLTLLTNVKDIEEMAKKYSELLPVLQKDDKFTILKYDTQPLVATQQEEQ